MSKIDVGPLAGYNSLTDRHLAGYFNNTRMRKHLVKSGLITRQGEVVPESVFRLNTSRKDHRRNVRDLLAQAIVHKTLDMERSRQVSIRRKLEEIAKIELVRRVRAERHRKGDEDILPLMSGRVRRPKRSPNRLQRDTDSHSDSEQGAGIDPIYVDADGMPLSPDAESRARLLKKFPDEEIDSKHLYALDSVALREYAKVLERYDRGKVSKSPYLMSQIPRPPTSGGPSSARRPMTAGPASGRMSRSTSAKKQVRVGSVPAAIEDASRPFQKPRQKCAFPDMAFASAKSVSRFMKMRELYEPTRTSPKDLGKLAMPSEHQKAPRKKKSLVEELSAVGRALQFRRSMGINRISPEGEVSDRSDRDMELFPLLEEEGSLVLHRTEPALMNQNRLQSMCEVEMRYFGQQVFTGREDVDPAQEVMVEQQHCGGNTLTVFRRRILPGTVFSFCSRRHRGYPFSLTFFINGVKDSRLSACCEYRHGQGSRLGGKQGHFGVVRVKGAAPCYKCQVERGSIPVESSSKPKRASKSKAAESSEDSVLTDAQVSRPSTDDYDDDFEVSPATPPVQTCMEEEEGPLEVEMQTEMEVDEVAKMAAAEEDEDTLREADEDLEIEYEDQFEDDVEEEEAEVEVETESEMETRQKPALTPTPPDSGRPAGQSFRASRGRRLRLRTEEEAAERPEAVPDEDEKQLEKEMEESIYGKEEDIDRKIEEDLSRRNGERSSDSRQTSADEEAMYSDFSNPTDWEPQKERKHPDGEEVPFDPPPYPGTSDEGPMTDSDLERKDIEIWEEKTSEEEKGNDSEPEGKNGRNSALNSAGNNLSGAKESVNIKQNNEEDSVNKTASSRRSSNTIDDNNETSRDKIVAREQQESYTSDEDESAYHAPDSEVAEEERTSVPTSLQESHRSDDKETSQGARKETKNEGTSLPQGIHENGAAELNRETKEDETERYSSPEAQPVADNEKNALNERGSSSPEQVQRKAETGGDSASSRESSQASVDDLKGLKDDETRQKTGQDTETRQKKGQDAETRQDKETVQDNEMRQNTEQENEARRDSETKQDNETRQMTGQDTESRQENETVQDNKTRQMTGEDTETRQMKGQDNETRQMTGQDNETRQMTGQDNETRQKIGEDTETRQMTGQDNDTRQKTGEDTETRPVTATAPSPGSAPSRMEEPESVRTDKSLGSSKEEQRVEDRPVSGRSEALDHNVQSSAEAETENRSHESSRTLPSDGSTKKRDYKDDFEDEADKAASDEEKMDSPKSGDGSSKSSSKASSKSSSSASSPRQTAGIEGAVGLVKQLSLAGYVRIPLLRLCSVFLQDLIIRPSKQDSESNHHEEEMVGRPVGFSDKEDEEEAKARSSSSSSSSSRSSSPKVEKLAAREGGDVAVDSESEDAGAPKVSSLVEHPTITVPVEDDDEEDNDRKDETDTVRKDEEPEKVEGTQDLADYEEEVKEETDEEVIPEAKTVTLSFITGDELGAGTNARIFCRLIGTEGTSDVVEVGDDDDSERRFERGSVDSFRLAVNGLKGRPKQIEVWHNGGGLGATWLLDKVLLLVDGEEFEFVFRNWIEGDQGEGLHHQIIDVGPSAVAAEKYEALIKAIEDPPLERDPSSQSSSDSSSDEAEEAKAVPTSVVESSSSPSSSSDEEEGEAHEDKGGASESGPDGGFDPDASLNAGDRPVLADAVDQAEKFRADGDVSEFVKPVAPDDPNNDACTVEVINTSLDAAQLARLAAVMRERPIECMNIRNGRIDDDKLRIILDVLESKDELKLLNLNCNGIGPKGASLIAERLARWTRLELLLLHGNPLLDDGINEIVSAIISRNQRAKDAGIVTGPLRSLDLGDSEMTNQGAYVVSRFMEENVPLESLELTGNRKIGLDGWRQIGTALGVNRCLRTLSVDYCSLRDDHLAALIARLPSNTSLLSLDLEGNEITDAGAQQLREMLVENGSLCDVSLRPGNTDVNDDLCEEIVEMAARNSDD